MIQCDGLSSLLCSPLSGQVVDLIQSVFRIMDVNRLGSVDIHTIHTHHCPSRDPSVLLGDRTAANIHSEFVDTLAMVCGLATMVDMELWITYWKYVHVYVNNSEYVPLLLTRVWAASSSTISDSRSSPRPITVVPLSVVLSATPPPTPPPTPSGSHTPSTKRKSTLSTTEFLKSGQFAACLVDPSLVAGQSCLTTSPKASKIRTLDAGLQNVVSKIKGLIQNHGLRKLVDVVRQLRAAVDGSGRLTFQTFYPVIRSLGDELRHPSTTDLKLLFQYMDVDHSGRVPLTTVVDLIRPPLTPKRLGIVRKAWSTLWPGVDTVDVDEVISSYHPHLHPHVVCGRSTAEEMFTLFIHTLDVDEQKMAYTQWIQYYVNISFFILDDEGFEWTVHSCWQLPSTITNTPSKSINKTNIHPSTSTNAYAILQPNRPQIASTDSKVIGEISHRLWTMIKTSGPLGFFKFYRALSPTFTVDNLLDVLQKWGRSTLSIVDVYSLFTSWDEQRLGRVDVANIMERLTGPLSLKRLEEVQSIFQQLDVDRQGMVKLRKLLTIYDPRHHPEVECGRMTETDIRNQFEEGLKLILGHTVDDQSEDVWTIENWIQYHQYQSPNVDDDDVFIKILRMGWRKSGPTLDRLSTLDRRPSLHNTSEGLSQCLGRSIHSPISINLDSGMQSPSSKYLEPGIQRIVSKFQQRVRAVGIYGFCMLTRGFRTLDVKETGLNLSDFRKVVDGLQFTTATPLPDMDPEDIRLLFQYIDQDRQGYIGLQQLLKGVQNPVSTTRHSLINNTFQKLDSGLGYLDPVDVVESYNASGHPEVVSGQKSESQVFQDFLDSFDLQSEKISFNQWKQYYENVSQGVMDEEYFSQMMMKTWRLHGNEDGRLVETLSEYHPESTLTNTSGCISPSSVQVKLQSSHISGNPIPAMKSTDSSNIKISSMNMNHKAQLSSISDNDNPMSGEVLLLILQHQLQLKTAQEICTIQKYLLQSGDVRNGQIHASKCAELLSSLFQLSLSEKNCRQLFQHINRQAEISTLKTSTSVSIEEKLYQQQISLQLQILVKSLIPDLSISSRRIVQQLFNKIQTEGRGNVLSTLLFKYFKPSQHPEVKLKLISESQAMQDFTSCFQPSDDRDTVIDIHMFERSCTLWRASIHSDAYFEMVLQMCFCGWN